MVMPQKLKEAVERFEAEVSAISYVGKCDVTVKGGKAAVVTFTDPDGWHLMLRDVKGEWYEYGAV